MRFKEFLLEQNAGAASQRVSTIEVDASDLKEFFSNNPIARKNLKNDICLYRGMGYEDGRYLFGDSRTFKRQSANTQNYLTTFLSTLDSWKSFPSRQHSFICSTGNNVSSGYGVKYAVFPADDAKIGYCEARDFWLAFKRGITFAGDLDTVNHLLVQLWRESDEGPYNQEPLSENDPLLLRKQLKTLDIKSVQKCVQKLNDRLSQRAKSRFISLERVMLDQNLKNVDEVLEHGFNPTLNSITAGTTSTMGNILMKYDDDGEEYESWVEGRCFFIRMSFYENEGRKIILDMLDEI
jgi:hypothetical protein